jgi:hypothetical protein
MTTLTEQNSNLELVSVHVQSNFIQKVNLPCHTLVALLPLVAKAYEQGIPKSLGSLQTLATVLPLLQKHINITNGIPTSLCSL